MVGAREQVDAAPPAAQGAAGANEAPARPATPRRWQGGALAFLLATLPGALLGTHFAALLFFLNPALPFSPGALLRGGIAYGALLGVAGALVQLPLVRRRPARVARLLPWTVTVALAAAAAADAFHASRYAFYLPGGINVRLLKAAALLGVAALVTFYTALLHTSSARPYGWRSRIGLALVALATMYAVVERREAYRARPEPDPRPTLVRLAEPPPLLVVAVESGTLDAVLPLARAGRLPYLAEMLERGAYGRVTSLSPTVSAAVWTTLATGKYPFRHGVRGGRLYRAPALGAGQPLSLLPLGVGFVRWGLVRPLAQPVPRQSLALPEVLARLGLAVAAERWPPVPGAWAAPAAAPEPAARFVWYGKLNRISRASFGGYTQVEFGGAEDPAARAAAERLGGAYVAFDEELRRLVDEAGGEAALVAVVSAYGLHPAAGGWLRPASRLRGGHTGAPDGLLLLAGPGVAPGALLTEVRLVDVVPTLLYGLGFPAATDLDGRLLTAAFSETTLARRALTFVPSYEALAGPTLPPRRGP